jgi:hypothetical protein
MKLQKKYKMDAILPCPLFPRAPPLSLRPPHFSPRVPPFSKRGKRGEWKVCPLFPHMQDNKFNIELQQGKIKKSLFYEKDAYGQDQGSPLGFTSLALLTQA